MIGTKGEPMRIGRSGKKEKILPRKIKDIELLVTERCNSTCTYCFQRKRPLDMDDSTVENIILKLKDKWDDGVMFTFFGGEPLLRKDFVMKWASRFLKEVPNCKLAVSTNGRIFDSEFALFWQSMPRTTFQISYDGVCQEKNRGDSDVVRENIKGYLQILGSARIKVRMTYLREDIETLYDSVVDCYELGFRDIYAQLAMPLTAGEPLSKEELIKYKAQIDRIYDFLAEHKEACMKPYNSELILKVQKDSCKQCGMGRTIIAIDAEGNTFPCHRMTSYMEFNLGNLNTDILQRGNFLHLTNEKKCEHCAARTFCNPCLATNYIETGSFIKMAKYICQIGHADYMKAQTTHNTKYQKVYTAEQTLLTMTHVLEDVFKGNIQIIKELKCLIC